MIQALEGLKYISQAVEDVQKSRKIEVIYIATEDKFVPFKNLDEIVGDNKTHLYYKPF